MAETQALSASEYDFTDVAKVNAEGIILNSLKEVECVLRIHNGEADAAAFSSPGADLAALAGSAISDLVGAMIAEAKGDIAAKGEYRRSYGSHDHGAKGSSFLKTTITIQRIDDKFVLNISSPYVGKKSEAELASLIGRPIAIKAPKSAL